MSAPIEIIDLTEEEPTTSSVPLKPVSPSKKRDSETMDSKPWWWVQKQKGEESESESESESSDSESDDGWNTDLENEYGSDEYRPCFKIFNLDKHDQAVMAIAEKRGDDDIFNLHRDMMAARKTKLREQLAAKKKRMSWILYFKILYK